MNTDLDIQQLTIQLQRWTNRRRVRDALLWLPRGLLLGLLLAVVVATVARYRPLLTNDEVAYLAGGLALTGLLIGLIVLLLKRYTLLQQAHFADRQFHLQERATTAIEVYRGDLPTTPLLARQQLADTLAAIGRVDTPAGLPLRLNRQDALLVVIAAILLVAAVLLPNPQADVLQEQRAVAASIEEQIESLEVLAEEIKQNPDLTEAQREELLQPIESALEELETGDLSREEAVATLSEAEAELRDLALTGDAERLRQALSNAGQTLAENDAGESLGQALQSGNLAQAGSAAAQLADNLPSLSAAEQQALAQDLAETAAALQSIDGELAQELAAAAEALQNGDVTAAQQALREAAATLQERAQEAAAAQQAAAAAGQLSQGRQEVAQAGREGASQPGQSEQGSDRGQGQGNDQGQGEAPGIEGQGQAEGPGIEQGEELGGPGPGGGHAENVFVPEFRDLSGEEGVEV
ncbi:MAG TPA: hypothetical protein VF177_00780, partial [Anaerolineae bacterium]